MASSERARERAVHRYYQTWLQSSLGFNSGAERESRSPRRFHLDGTPLRASRDKALIAFAQLGCLRLNAKRGVVTLLSTTRQYILAEATKTTSLNVTYDNHDPGDDLGFGNASINRSEGISEDALNPNAYTATGPDGATYTARALVVNDIASDSKYSRREYAGNGVNFYCGVPIVTASGESIGVYTVTDDKPRDGLSPQELCFMQDMASTVMDHLEAVKNDLARFRGERLVLGLGRFVQGESTIYQEQSEDFNSSVNSDSHKAELPIGDEQVVTRFKGLTITDANPALLQGFNNSRRDEARSVSDGDDTAKILKSGTQRDAKSESEAILEGKGQIDEANPKLHSTLVLEASGSPFTMSSSSSQETEQLFSRAANILRECATADGVIFYDAVFHNFARGPPASNCISTKKPSKETAVESASIDENTATDSSSSYSDRNTSVSSEFSDDGRSPNILSSRGRRAKMLGHSLNISNESTVNVDSIKTLRLTERSLRRMIRRYPKGKMFYFSHSGEASSDSDPPNSSPQGKATEYHLDGYQKRAKLPTSNKSIAEELIRIVPGARSVMWLPLWDFNKQRWSAGTFLWSRQSEKLLSAQEDLTYLQTFGSCIIGEVARLEASSADKIRTSFIANISHELRSPLHGILGSIEFLQDTPLDAFQSAMTNAVETSGKTLLDTVDHVLEYAQINNLSKRYSKRSRGGKRRQKRSEYDDHYNTPSWEDDFDLAVVIEEVVEACFAGQTFRSAPKIDQKDTISAESRAHSNKSLQTTRKIIERESTKFSGAVRVVLAVEKQDDWWVHGQRGAIRRIVMNLFGNSLKYTERGTIQVSLTMDSHTTESSKVFCIAVKDTGIGMAPSFLHNHAFAAFTQESSFSVGAGLGLNIVQQIVNSLGGKIEVDSDQGIGTEIKVWMTLPSAPSPTSGSDNDDLLLKIAQRTSGQTMCILNPKARRGKEQVQKAEPGVIVQSALQHLVETWFGMKTITSLTMENVSADIFVYTEPPPIECLVEDHGIHARNSEVPVIVIATNAFESSSLLANGIQRLTDIGRVVEVMAQPCGPQKMAKVFHRAMMRLANLARDPQSQHTTAPANMDVIDGRRNSHTYLGDSDSQEKIETRLQRDHADHQQPNEDPPGTSRSSHSRVNHETESGHVPVTLETPSPELTKGGPSEGSHEERALTLPHPAPQTPSSTSRQSTIGSSSTGLDKGSSPLDEDPKTPHVLLVDDNQINLNLLKAFMRKAKLSYEAVTDGLQALEACKQAAAAAGSHFQHILMDISMPVMDGITSTREIRRLENKARLRPANIIALTGQASESTREELFRAGGDQFLTKPVKFKELMYLLKS